MQVSSKTDTGLVRSENQDRVKCLLLEEDTVLVVICDGMGGENAGSEASRITVSEIVKRITSGFRHHFDGNSLRNLMLSSINAANSLVYEKSQNNSEMEGMGTTCIVGIVKQDVAYIYSVGDSRVYLIHDGMKQITKDHTYVQMLYDRGEITEQQMKNHVQRNIITRAVGINNSVNADYYEIEFPENGVLLFCTDGLSTYCDQSRIEEIILNNDLEQASSQLIEYANCCGGKDNATVALINNVSL